MPGSHYWIGRCFATILSIAFTTCIALLCTMQKVSSWKRNEKTRIRMAEWYLHYGRKTSFTLEDVLEAHRLFIAAGEIQRAGEASNSLWELFKSFGLYETWRTLC